jgi:3-hydroxyisobutyrate dehydrogenase-like beta-hydroxyacid dehydrogenase
MASPTVAVIGLGTIGGGVAEALCRAGYRPVVRDVRPEAAARFAERAEVAASTAEALRAEVAVVAVVDDAQLRAVVAESGPSPGPSRVLVVLSTVSPGCLADVRRSLASTGTAVVDCGVSGGPAAAAAGDLVCMVGGEDEAVERVRPVLQAFSAEVVHVGPPGTGLAAKLARNLVQYAAWMAALDGARLAEAAGVPLATLAQVVRAADARSGGVTALMFRATAAPFGPDDDPGLVEAMRTGASLARKDLQAALGMGRALGVHLPAGELAEARCEEIFGVGEPAVVDG